MFCENCGQEVDEGIKLCGTCEFDAFQNSSEEVSIENEVRNDDNFMSKPLISGNGNGSGMLMFGIVAAIVFFVCAGIFGYTDKIDYVSSVSSFFGGRGLTTVRVQNSLFPFLIIGGILAFIYGTLAHNAASRTKIEVYKDRVEGIGFSGDFLATSNFLFNIDQVAISIDSDGLSVHSLGSKYKVYVDNGLEIQKVIFELKKS